MLDHLTASSAAARFGNAYGRSPLAARFRRALDVFSTNSANFRVALLLLLLFLFFQLFFLYLSFSLDLW